MSPRILLTAFGTCAMLAACNPAPGVTRFSEPALVQTFQQAPPGAPDGSCWGKEVTPPRYKTVSGHVMVQPAQVLADGTVMSEPIYKREDRKAIIEPQRELWFRMPCEADLPPDFTASLQRALQARGHYHGAITGEMDGRTRHAVRRYQAPQGLDSAILSLAAARKLGLVPVERPEKE
ncbi:peptidoglycan-binding domain-containing protein [Marimonas arenosa]|uniref:Peptidoglycan-binding protein n=1 Tax=Marimonas arenosa TaxID=1795305 RepID=A0AAE3WEV3_9RHOB|nr:peptidoglycan-binding domain-containing protein [Marimonas arenosa]MDQ2091080.1 peptidoglycan-binding protein [Marimonas arenosa]